MTKKVYKRNLFLTLLALCFSFQLYANPWEISAEEFENYIYSSDHASLDVRHIQASHDFYERNLKTNGCFDAEKIAIFLDVLKNEKEWIKNDIYETTLLEKLELNVKKYKKAIKNAKKKISENKSPFLRAYNEYLIPKMEELYLLVKDKRSPEKWQGLVDAFARGYYPFHIPNAYRSVWLMDADILYFVQQLFLDRKFKKLDQEKVEANNLIVSDKNIDEIKSCLTNDSSISIDHHLTQYEIEKLMNCGVDISDIDPGISPFWEEKTAERVEKELSSRSNWFPDPEDKVYYDGVSFRGAGTAKFRAVFTRDDKEIEFRVKMGKEVHTDNVVSQLLTIMGFNQDTLQYRKEMKLYFKDDDSYEDMISQFANKYDPQSVYQFITAYGSDEDGSRWVLVEDVNLEGRPKYEIRVSPIDIFSWDLPNRREVRGSLLVIAWLEIFDVRPGNYKLVYQENDCCGLIPKIRLQDVGQALGGPLNLRNPSYILSFSDIYQVNQFATSIIRRNDKHDKLSLVWNDFFNRKRNFKTTTYHDLRWMARKIAKLSKETVYNSFLDAGIPEDVADIYTIKLMMRRNELIDFLDLGDEFPAVEVPDLKSYSPNENIKNGKVVKRVFENKNVPVHVQQTWLTFLQGLLNFDVTLSSWKETQHTGLGGSTGLAGLSGLRTGLSLSDVPVSKTTSIPLGVGVQATLTRTVTPNHSVMNEGGKLRLFKITDKVSIEIGIDSGLLGQIIKSLPVLQFHYGLRFYTKEFEHIHYADNGNKAFLEPFELHKVIDNIEFFSAFKLKPLDIVRVYENFGIDADVGAGAYSFDPLFVNEVSVTGGSHKVLSQYFTRDMYNQLHFFDDRLRQSYAGLNLDIARINLFLAELPFFSLKAGASAFKLNSTDYIFKNEVHDRRLNEKIVTPAQRFKEYMYLKKIRDGKFAEIDYEPLQENFKIEAKGKNSVFGIGALFIFNLEKVKQENTVSVQSQATKDVGFYRYKVTRHRSIGVNSPVSAVQELDVMTAKRKRESITVEMDYKNPEDFVTIVRLEDFYMTRKHQDVLKLINDLNFRYSFDQENLFYNKYYLPTDIDVKKHKKVYALTRLFLNGKKLVKKIKSTPKDILTNMIYRHFASDDRFLVNGSFKHLNIFQIAYAHYKSSWVKHSIKKIKKLLLLEDKRDFRKIAKNYEKLLHRLDIPHYGVDFLYALLGTKGMYVMGEISGLLRSFSTLQDLQQIQRVRFMGQSWGTYKKVPPIQKFLRKHRIVYPSIHIEKNMSDNTIFGPLETVVAPNLESIYSHNAQF